MAASTSGDQPLRVLQLGKYYWPDKGGIETVVRSLCEGLREHVEIRVLVANQSNRSEESLVDGVQVSRASQWFRLSSAPVCPGMVRYIREAAPDLIHIHLPNPGAELAVLASGVKVPLVANYHSDIVRQRLSGLAFGPLHQSLLRRSAAIILSSEELLNRTPALASHRDRCHVIPYGISTSGLEEVDEAAVAQLRERYGPRMVLSVGRLVYYKGFEFLIRAMREVEGHLVIVGDGPLWNSLQNLIQSLGMTSRVTLLRGCEDVGPHYHAAQVFVLASTHRAETFGIVQLEAMARGKPVVNTSIPTSVPSVSLDGVTGLTVPPGDAPALAAAINRLLDDPELRARFGAAGRQRVWSEFRSEDMIQRVLGLYRKVLRNGA